MDGDRPPAGSRHRSRGFSLRAAAILALLGFSLGLGIALFVLREPTEPLSRDNLKSGRARWAAAHINNYDLTIRMRGAEYHVTVRRGLVELITSGGNTTQTTDPGAYSIDGIFRVLEQELDAAERFAVRPVMRARFNDALGYPERYLRGAGEMGAAASIETLLFRRVNVP